MAVWHSFGSSRAPFPTGVVARHALFSELQREWSEAWSVWLTADEQEHLAQLHHPARRRAWLGGRLLTKQLILDSVGDMLPSMIQVYSRDGLGRATRPRVLVEGQLQDWSLSIAHSDRSVLVAMALTPGYHVGVDLVPLRPLGDGFAALWLTSREQAQVRRGGSRAEPHLAATLWAMKEAFYKATNTGERFAPRRIEALPDAWGRWNVWANGGETFHSRQVVVRDTPREVAVILTAGEGRRRD